MKTWHQHFFDNCDILAEKSKDPSSQFGAIIVNKDQYPVASGFNGFPRGVNDTEERLHDREVKYKLVCHAEANAIAAAAKNGHALDGCYLYVQAIPCNECAKLIVQAGIKRVYIPKRDHVDYLSRWGESVQWSELIFREAGVEVIYVDLDEKELR